MSESDPNPYRPPVVKSDVAASKVTCVQCGGPTVRGDLRSGALSFGDFFLQHDGDRKSIIGQPKLKGMLQTNNRVISFACLDCGFISSFLEDKQGEA